MADIAVQMTKVEADIENVNNQIIQIENEIAETKGKAEDARIKGSEKFQMVYLKMVQTLMDEENQLMDEKKQLRDRVNQLEEQKTVLLKLIHNEGFIDQEKKQKAIARGEAFVKAIIANMEEIKVTGNRKSDAEPVVNQNITAEAQKSPLDESGEPPEKRMTFCTAEQDKPQSMTKDGQVASKNVAAGTDAIQTTEDAEGYEIQGMKLLKNVPMLETGARRDVVVAQSQNLSGRLALNEWTRSIENIVYVPSGHQALARRLQLPY